MANVNEMPNEAEETVEQPTMTKEEIELRRKQITEFYKENIKNLKVQLEYEKLLTDIEKARAERIQAQMFIAQAYAEHPEDGDHDIDKAEEEFEAAKQGRTLKRKTNETA